MEARFDVRFQCLGCAVKEGDKECRLLVGDGKHAKAVPGM